MAKSLYSTYTWVPIGTTISDQSEPGSSDIKSTSHSSKLQGWSHTINWLTILFRTPVAGS